jgi:hypothetical protein
MSTAQRFKSYLQRRHEQLLAGAGGKSELEAIDS